MIAPRSISAEFSSGILEAKPKEEPGSTVDRSLEVRRCAMESSFSPASGRLFTMRNLMNRFTLSLLVSVLSVGMASTAYAQSKTREQVLQELQQARAAGLITYGEQAYPPAFSQLSTKTRARVGEELREAKAAGLVNNAEQAYPPALLETSSQSKPRGEIRAELDAAKAAGQISFGELDYPPDTNG